MCTPSASDRHYELMVFDYETTNRTDFRDGEILPHQEPVIEVPPRVSKIKKQEFHLKDTHTVNEYKDPNFPFDLLAVPKEIIRTNCRDIQKPYEKLVDTELDTVRQTRPRVQMVSGISIDDIQDERKRHLIIEDTYTTSYVKASKYLDGRYDNSRYTAPLGNTSKTNPVMSQAAEVINFVFKLALPPVREQPYVDQEFRWPSVKWEREQARGHVDPTIEFWKRLPNRKH